MDKRKIMVIGAWTTEAPALASAYAIEVEKVELLADRLEEQNSKQQLKSENMIQSMINQLALASAIGQTWFINNTRADVYSPRLLNQRQKRKRWRQSPTSRPCKNRS